MTIKIFTGYDKREADGWHAFIQSLIDTSVDYVICPPLSGDQADGTNAFTYQRFLVPELCNWAGKALFVDGADMLLRASVGQLVDLYDKRFAVQVVKHDYQTKHPVKYVGTSMQAPNSSYDRKNWSSLILWNCGHMAHFRARDDIRRAVEEGDGKYLHRFAWLKDDEIGDLPKEWNWLCQEYGENPDAKLIHYTAGIPSFEHYKDGEMSEPWHQTAKTFHSKR
jgi:hypothetical protein